MGSGWKNGGAGEGGIERSMDGCDLMGGWADAWMDGRLIGWRERERERWLIGWKKRWKSEWRNLGGVREKDAEKRK